jgi:hypothetical protein
MSPDLATAHEKHTAKVTFSCRPSERDLYRRWFGPGEFSKEMRLLANAVVAARIKKAKGKA